MADTCTAKTCGAPIAWAVTTTGKRMPIDANADGTWAEVADGNVRRTGRTGADSRGHHLPEVEVVVGGQLDLGLGDVEPRFMPHFATCPAAPEFRRS